MPFRAVEKALEDYRQGKMIILVDDEERENEGDLCIAGEKVTPEAINFMAKHGRGLICLALTDERIAQLALPMMVDQNTSPYETAFTVSIEASRGVTTGISAADRATTVQAAVAKGATPDDLVRPGHIFPLRARPGGVLVRTGQTEGSVDLARLADLEPASVICEIMNEDGSMSRMPELEKFAAVHDLPIISIADIIEYRLAHESLVRRITEREVEHPQWGRVRLVVYGTSIDEREHLAVVKGDLETGAPLVRVHSGYPLSSVFGDLFSNDRALLNEALKYLAAEQSGVLLCVDQGRSPKRLQERVEEIGESKKVDLSLEDKNKPMIQREFGVGAQILRDLGLTKLRLLTNNPRRLAALSGYGLEVVESIPLPIEDAKVLKLVRSLEVVNDSQG